MKNHDHNKQNFQQRHEQRFRKHHLPIAIVTLILIIGFYQALPSPDSRFRLSMATAYTSLLWLGATLVTGAWNVLRSHPNPLSTDLRRDLGIWAAIVGFAHVLIGLSVHMSGKYWLYFFYPANESHFLPIRLDPFGFANYTGLIATVILGLLLAISNDFSLRWLGGKRWKDLQRWNYGLFMLVSVHGIVYQLVEKRQFPYPLIFLAMVAGVVAIQVAGYRRHTDQLRLRQ